MWHRGHKLEIATYGEGEDVVNVAIECLECNEVLLDFDNPKAWGDSDSIQINDK